MQTKFDPTEAARFLRTLRVATGVATALEDMRRGRGRAGASVTFQALAAKTGVWRFPEEGVLSGDGLLIAKRHRDPDGAGALILQAQGAVGVTTYAGRPARARIGEAWAGEGVFDRFGALHLALDADEVDDSDLARIDVEMLDDAP
ncbi:MAG: hypothetical protein KGM15_13800 [Pseudomonadota bacterium]|nr:hypothetical protein [Pseudomonadota bacterium]